MREIFLKFLVCCAVLLLVSVAGGVLLINHLIVTIGSLVHKKPTARNRFG